MFGFNSKAQREAQAAAQRAAEEAQAEAEYKAYWQGRNDERRAIANNRNVVQPVTGQEIADVMSNRIARQARPDVPMRRVNR